MHRPSVPELLKEGESYYSLVLAVAKRARQIVDDANEKGEIVVEKPVSLAVDDFVAGRIRMAKNVEEDKDGE